jgi:hypothetical protein
MERALLWQDQCHRHQKGNFKSSRKILRSWQLSKSRIHFFGPGGPVMSPDARTLFKIWEKSSYPLQTRIGKDSLQQSRWCFRPYDRATPSGRDLNMDMHEACYGKAVAQFTIRTLYESVRTPPKEIRINGDLGFLCL